MKIKNIIQSQLVDIKTLDIDLFVCSSGYEERATFFSGKLDFSRVTRKAVFAFNDKETEFSRKKNDTFFKANNFEFINCDGDFEDDVYKYLSSFLFENTSKALNIVIDYSCMTRIWYGAILKFFKFKEIDELKLHLYFCYSIAKYTKASTGDNFNIHIGPIAGFTHLSIPQKPTALIIGLGYEQDRAIGLTEYFDGETFLFYTDITKEPNYSKEVELNNKDLMSSIRKENIYTYPINDLKYTYRNLFSLCQDISNDYRIIIAPCGPKPFTLISLVIALNLESVDVWRISSGKEATPVEKVAEGEILILDLSIEN